MTAGLHRLVVDFGTSTTIAMLLRPDGRVQPLLFDGSPLLSSAVLLGPDGQLHTGRDAAHLARSAPERLEPNPKRRIDETVVLLGDREVDVRDLIAAVLRRVAIEAERVAGPVHDLTLTHPAAWGAGRRAVLVDAAQRAGFSTAELVSEPLAAATYFARMRGGGLPPGACVLVYDLGGGTCDVTILRRQPHGFDPVASEGLGDVGGLDVDAAVVAFLQATYGELWTSVAGRRQVWDEVRSAKEMLSRASGTVIMVPALQKEVPLGREQLEELARPVLRSTTAMTRRLLLEANVPVEAIAGLFLVGGSSRIPLVATLLHEALGIPPIVAEQPELVVAEGALYVRQPPGPVTAQTGQATPTPAPISSLPAMPVSSTPISPMPISAMPAAPVSPTPRSMPAQTPMSGSGPMQGPMRTPMQGPMQSPMHGPMQGSVQGSMQGSMQGPIPGPGPMPPRPPLPPPGPARSGRGGGFIAVIVGVAVVALALVIGGSAAIYTVVKKANGGSSPTGFKPSINVPSLSPWSGQTGSPESAAAAKYDIKKIPENLCGVLDIGAVTSVFEAESGSPSGNRNLSTLFGSASCILSRQHNNSAKLPVSVGTLSFSMHVFSDTGTAESTQKQTLDNAKLNSGTVTDVKDIGDTGFMHEQKSNTANPGSEAAYVVEARDGNLRWSATVIGTRIDKVAWTDAERRDLQNRLLSMAKASFIKATAGMR
jgi:actin-like ATPase involved in cell morphogenesis